MRTVSWIVTYNLIAAFFFSLVAQAATTGPFPHPFELSTLSGTNGFTIKGISTGVADISDAGELNGDGIGDPVVGADTASPNGKLTAGQTYVVFGRPAGYPFPVP